MEYGNLPSLLNLYYYIATFIFGNGEEQERKKTGVNRERTRLAAVPSRLISPAVRLRCSRKPYRVAGFTRLFKLRNRRKILINLFRLFRSFCPFRRKNFFGGRDCREPEVRAGNPTK